MKDRWAKDLLLTETMRVKFVIISLFLLMACGQTNAPKTDYKANSLGTITYDIPISNNNPEDTWAEECIAGFDRKDFLDKYFEAVYQHKITVVDYFTGEKIDADKIQEMEKNGEIVREKIVRVRFEEEWYWNDKSNQVEKRIKSVTMAYEVFNNLGESRGYKPIFKIDYPSKQEGE